MSTLLRIWKWFLPLVLLVGFLSFSLTACGPTADQIAPRQTAVINPKFQTQLSPVPTPQTFRCGAWVLNNAPAPTSMLTIYARLTNQAQGVAGATATAIAHLDTGDQQLPQPAASDQGGYVTFQLQLQGQQPSQHPATIDVTFTNIPNGPTSLKCTSAFFTPK